MLGYQFTLIGHPLGHSMSPWIHERLFKLADKTASYTLTDIAPEDLNASVDELRKLRGFNVTIPYKTDILPHLKELDEWAARYQSVNTVAVNSDGELFGYNTDCAGFLHSVGEIPAGSKALLIGCVALRFPGQELAFDPKAMKFTNNPAANEFLKAPKRGDWDFAKLAAR